MINYTKILPISLCNLLNYFIKNVSLLLHLNSRIVDRQIDVIREGVVYQPILYLFCFQATRRGAPTAVTVYVLPSFLFRDEEEL